MHGCVINAQLIVVFLLSMQKQVLLGHSAYRECHSKMYFSSIMRKPTIWVPYHIRHKLYEHKKWLKAENFLFRMYLIILASYSKADLRFCFHMFKMLVFPCSGSFLFFQAILKEFNRNISDVRKIIVNSEKS